MKTKLGKTKEVHTHKVFFKEAGTGKQKSFTCSKDMLQWHLKEAQKMNTNVRYERST